MNDRESRLWEYIRSLQAQIDSLTDQDDARLRRIERLEEDRRKLREQLAAKTRRRFGRVTAPLDQPPTATEAPVLDVPGVGPIGEATPSRTRPRRPITVAAVLDPISHAVLAPEFHLVSLSARTWEETVTASPPDLLLVESAYRGYDGSWASRIARLGSPSTHLVRLVEWFRSNHIPTVFWNKEDPANFDWFIHSAGLFDFVFTVDADLLDRYRHELGHSRVGLLPFFAQPALHRPGDPAERAGTVAFAGSYYAAKHPERREQMEIVVDPARDFGLHIFDRHGRTEDPRFAWPEKYRPHIVGSLTYLQTVEAYRRYRIFLNVNSVTESSTMCPRRIFELAACETPVVSTPAKAISSLVPNGAIFLVETAAQARAIIRRLLDQPEVGAEAAAVASRWVAEEHTSVHRVDSMLETVGLT